MKRTPLILCLFLLVAAMPAAAQLPLPAVAAKAGEIITRPVCGQLVNRSSVNILGSVATMPQNLPDGTPVRHKTNFKLAPSERKEICSTGPFYEGRKLELTIRTLVPLFSCYTQIGGEVFLDMREDRDGVKRYSATCY